MANATADKAAADKAAANAAGHEAKADRERHNIWLHSRWTPREWNTEADDLMNEKFEAFERGLLIPARVEVLPWLVLPRLLETGLAWQRQ